jgi:hypothetical protein
MQFDFKKKDFHKMKINDTLFLCIERITNSYSTLYLQNDKDIIVNIPNEITVYDRVYDDNNCVLQLKKSNGMFYTLGWTENFVIKYMDQTILTINNPRVWDLYFNEK